MVGTRQKLYFCFPYRGAGGVSLLFLRLAEHLELNGAFDITLIDYEDGFMAKNLKSERINLLAYADDGQVQIPSDAILILQSMNPWSIFPGISIAPETRLVFWNCYPFNLVPVLPGVRDFLYRSPRLLKGVLRTALQGRRKKNVKLVRWMHAAKSLFFMDRENLEMTERFLGLSLPDPVFLPIPAPERASAVASSAQASDKSIRAVWVGRLADFKVHALWRALQDLNAWAAAGYSVKVDIIGDGDRKEFMQSHCEGLANIDVEFVDPMPSDALSQRLNDGRYDLAFCMGTSALETAQAGIATVLLDPSYAPIGDGYRYRWLYETTDYILGRMLLQRSDWPAGQALDALLGDLQAQPEAVAQAGRDYVMNHHSMPKVAEKFGHLVGSADYTWHRLRADGIDSRDIVYRIFVKLRQVIRRKH